jgi:hypothetical protein
MKWYASGLILEVGKENHFVINMKLKLGVKQAEFLMNERIGNNRLRFIEKFMFMEKSLRLSITQCDPNAHVLCVLDTQDPRRGKTFGQIRVQVRINHPYDAAIAAILLYRKKAKTYALSSGYDCADRPRRVGNRVDKSAGTAKPFENNSNPFEFESL